MTENPVKSEKLFVLWSSGDREVATKMVFMYTLNAKLRGWWNDVSLIVWGPSAQLVSQDKELQAKIKEMKDAGVELMACKACSDSYEVSESLDALGIEVKYMGEPLTQILKGNDKIITF
jgi:hypothetical protein